MHGQKDKSGIQLKFYAALEHLKDFAKADLEFFLSNSFQEFDRVASLLLPTSEAEKINKPNESVPEPASAFGSVGINLED